MRFILSVILGLVFCQQALAMLNFADNHFEPIVVADNTQDAPISGTTHKKETSVLTQRIKALTANLSSKNVGRKFAFQVYEPNYVLPYFYNSKPSPYYAGHPGSTPDDVSIKKQEFKIQLSLLMPLWDRVFNLPISLSAAYTQSMFWQVYSKSPYFRETNYEPRLFLSTMASKNVLVSLGVDHQSNGRGGETKDGMERSWNRVFADVFYSKGQWLLGLEPWMPILKSSSQDKHNPDITDYLGYARALLVYKFSNHQEVSMVLRNVVESGFKRGSVQVSYSYPLHGMVSLYVQGFSGYGESLIEYDHYTNAIGLGVAFSNWV